MKKPEKEFQTIIDEAISRAEGVECEFGAFVEGLDSMLDTLRDRRDMARDELRERQRAESDE